MSLALSLCVDVVCGVMRFTLLLAARALWRAGSKLKQQVCLEVKQQQR
jgi:hypothetical protein